MLYAILAYHVEAEVLSWTPEADAALMTELHRVHDRFKQAGRLGPAARLGETGKARTLRGPGSGLVIDGPFAETKELVAGYWVWHCASLQEAIEWVKRCPNPMPEESEIEIRPFYELEDFGEALTSEHREKFEGMRGELAQTGGGKTGG